MSKRLWSARRYLLEIKIGTFFLIGLFLFFVAVVSIRQATFFKNTFTIKVQFKFAEGLRASSPVRFCGVDVGEVENVDVVSKDGQMPIVCVYAKVDPSAKIPRGSSFFVNSLSLFGEKYLEITPPLEIKKGYLENNDVVDGLSPIPLFAMFLDFDKTMADVAAFVREGDIKDSLAQTLVNMRDTTDSLKAILGDVHNGKGTVGKLFYDDTLYKELDEFVADIKAHPWKLLYKSGGK